jgi:histone-binding protein RBBP4
VRSVEGTNLSVHRAILGTHTSNGAQNYLQIAHIEIPDNRTPASAELNERGEVGGYANAKRPFEFKIVQNINHPGDVNKARYQPQNPDIIATHCEDGRVLIFDRTKHPLQPKNDSSIKCEAELVGHEDQGFGLAWSPLETGHLVTGTQDTTVRTWDLKSGFSKDTKTVSPTATYKYHSATVNDVQYHPSYPLIGTASDDLTWTVIDTRVSSQKPPTFRKQAHDDAVNCIAFHPEFECLFVTGSSDKTISMWDLRNTNQKLHSFQGSNGAISSLQWQPQDVCILASSSDDRRIRYWDISKTGEEQTPEEAEDGPSEL